MAQKLVKTFRKVVKLMTFLRISSASDRALTAGNLEMPVNPGVIYGPVHGYMDQLNTGILEHWHPWPLTLASLTRGTRGYHPAYAIRVHTGSARVSHRPCPGYTVSWPPPSATTSRYRTPRDRRTDTAHQARLRNAAKMTLRPWPSERSLITDLLINLWPKPLVEVSVLTEK